MTKPDFADSLAELYGTLPPEFSVDKLLGDASTRSYYRVVVSGGSEGPSSLIVMQLPDDAFASEEGGSQPSAERLPFLEIGELLEACDIPVPKVYGAYIERGQILLEDLGDMTFQQRVMETPRTGLDELYGRAVELLAEIHEAMQPVPSESIVGRRRFDRALLKWELDHFQRWGLEELIGKLSGPEVTAVEESFTEIVDAIEAMPYGFVHRDYQSRNLMVGPTGGLTVIDFQDALLGPRTYDLVALLCDSYVALDLDLQNTMIDRYAALRRADPDDIRREFWIVALHRKLKDAGRFVFIDRVRSNASFLQWYPQSLVYVGRALGQAATFAGLCDLLYSRIPGFPGAVEKPSSSMK